MKILNTKNITKLLAILLISALTFTACSKDDDHGDDLNHEEELITTVTYTLTNGNDIVTFVFQDLDGEGGADGTYTISGPLTAGTTYTGIMKLENETENPAENITEEVEAESDEHEFFYTTSIASITKTDADSNGNPLGIETSVVTGNAGTGTITITLIHEPKKPNSGISDAGGSTDVQAIIPVTVQ